jgi:hypothetical protein
MSVSKQLRKKLASSLRGIVANNKFQDTKQETKIDGKLCIIFFVYLFLLFIQSQFRFIDLQSDKLYRAEVTINLFLYYFYARPVILQSGNKVIICRGIDQILGNVVRTTDRC